MKTASKKTEAAALSLIDRVAGNIVHFTTPRGYQRRIFDHLTSEGLAANEIDRDAIDSAIDVLGFQRAEEDEA